MKKINPVYFVMIVMLLAGLFLVGRSAYRIFTRKPLVVESAPPAIDPEAQKRMDEVRDLDIGILEKSEELPAGEVAKSLLRLQRQAKTHSPKYIAQFITSEKEEIRAAALEAAAALGMDSYENQIREAIKSDNQVFRLAVVNGLGQQSTERSRKILAEYWGRGVKDPKERFAALLSMQRVARYPEDREKWQKQLIGELRSYKGDDLPLAWVDTFRSLPASESLIEGAWELVKKATASEASFRALLYLRDFAGPAALKSQLGQIEVAADRRYQMALIDLIFDYCPQGWNELVKKIMSQNPDPSVKKGLEEAELSVKCL